MIAEVEFCESMEKDIFVIFNPIKILKTTIMKLKDLAHFLWQKFCSCCLFSQASIKCDQHATTHVCLEYSSQDW